MTGKLMPWGQFNRAEPAVSASQTPGAQPAPSAPGTDPRVPETPGVSPAPSAGRAPTRPLVSVEPVAGHTAVPNAILDRLLARLEPHDQLVYLRLFRLSHGFARDTCRVGYETLAKSTNLGRRSVIRAVERLEGIGLVRREPTDPRAPNAERGNVYTVILPEGVSAPRAPGAGSARSAPAARMKESGVKETLESASPEQVRRYAAAALHELHQHEPDATPERRREWLQAWALEAGHPWAAVEGALRG